jgi:hypothetical protein
MGHKRLPCCTHSPAMAAIRIKSLCIAARALHTGEDLVGAVVKQWVDHFLLDLFCNVLDCVHPPLG